MITRVEIAGYKSLSEVELDLRPLSVIVGPNASGKSKPVRRAAPPERRWSLSLI